MENNLYLVYVNHYADNPDGSYVYELYYSDNVDVVWGLDWECLNPSICDDLEPDPQTIAKKVKVSVKYPLKTIEETSCYSMLYAVMRIIALSWIDIDNLTEYPDEGRCVLHFGDSEEDVNKILADIIVE